MEKRSVRDQIIETASRLFYTQGYGNTGINQIIEEAGIAKASLYQHFRSKEDLLIDYLELAGIRMNDRLQAATELYDTPVGKIAAIFDVLEELTQRNTYNGCRFLNIIAEMPMADQRVREQVLAQKDSVRNLFREVLRPIKKDGMADELYLLFEAVLSTTKIHREKWPVELARRMAMRLIGE